MHNSAGGHTAEMLRLLDTMDAARYCPRSFVVADTDCLSASKACAFEGRVPRQAGRNVISQDGIQVRRSGDGLRLLEPPSSYAGGCYKHLCCWRHHCTPLKHASARILM